MTHPRARGALALAALGGLLVALYALLVAGEARRSHTADEPNHLLRGIAYWQTGDARLSYPHPPLANALGALPLGDRLDRLDVTALPGWAEENAQRLGRAYFTADFEAAREELAIARRSIAALTVVFAAFFAGFCWRRWGAGTAVVALALFVGHPTLLAHGGLMTTDMPATAMTFVVLALFCGLCERPGWPRLFAFATAVGLLLATKHSGGPMVAILAAIGALLAWRGAGPFVGRTRRRALGRWLVALGVVGVVACLVINAAYRFQQTGMTAAEIAAEPEPDNWISRRFRRDLIDDTQPLPGLRAPLPYPYLLGLATISGQNRIGHQSYLAGIHSKRNPLYFPVMIVIKTPVGLLILLGVGLWLWRRRIARPGLDLRIMLGFAVAFVALASAARINIGVRHVLPVFPLMIAAAARAGVIAWRAWAGRPGLRALLGIATVSAVAAGPIASPRYLGHFSALVGGRAGGHHISMIGEDWGQDMVDVADALRGETRTVHYYTVWVLRILELERAGLAVQRLSCKVIPPAGVPVVIHRTDLLRKRERCLFWLDACERTAVVNDHVELYECRDGEALERAREEEARRALAEAAEAAAADDDDDDDDDDPRR